MAGKSNVKLTKNNTVCIIYVSDNEVVMNTPSHLRIRQNPRGMSCGITRDQESFYVMVYHVTKHNTLTFQ